MRTWITENLFWVIVTLFVVAIMATVAFAGPPCVSARCNKIAVQSFVPVQQQAVTVFTVPVPNAIYSTAPQQAVQASSLDYLELVSELRQIKELLAAGAGGVRATAADPLRLTRQFCGKCHSNGQSKGNFSFSTDLDCEQRLHAMSMVLHDDPARAMPKGRQLTDQERGLLLQELAKKPTVASQPLRVQSEAPPKPEAE